MGFFTKQKSRQPRQSRYTRPAPPCFHWVPPAGNIIPYPPNQTRNIDGEPETSTMTGLLLACGVAAISTGVAVGAAVITYSYNLVNIKDYAKAKKAAEAISARLHRRVMFSSDPAADFALVVERLTRATLHIKDVASHTSYNNSRSATACFFGSDTRNNMVAADLASLPHLLIAGATGSGKSVLLHTIICTMLFKGTPDKLQFIMIDPKRIELSAYAGLPHLQRGVVTEVPEAISVLEDVCMIMDSRYQELEYNPNAQFPKLVVVIEELADLMLVSKHQVETSIVRIAQLGRAAGIHLICATQRPTVNVVTGLIKANITARIALTMASYRDAGVVEIPGADKLSGMGDALYQQPNHTIKPIRFQSAYITPDGVQRIVGYWKSDYAKRYE